MSDIIAGWDQRGNISLQRNVICPSRAPDYENNWSRFWFREMVTTRVKSNLSWETYVLAMCPVTHKLIYFTGYASYCWDFVQERAVNDAYESWLNGQCDEHFAS